MMILFTSGFPYAGKTKFAKTLLDKLDRNKAIHIDPKDYYVENFKELSSDEQSAVGITAWELSMEKTQKCVELLPNKALIILDTCCAKFNVIKPLINDAKGAGHSIYCVFVNSSLEDRKSRASGKDIESFEQRYAKDFQFTLPRLEKLTDKFVIVHNNNVIGQSELNKCAELLSETIIGIQSE